MKSYLPDIIETIAGTVLFVLGITYILITFNSREVSSAGALFFLVLGLGTLSAGVMNIFLVSDRIGRSVIAINAAGVVCFAAANFLNVDIFALAGFLLFAIALICSFLVAARNDRTRHYPYGLNANQGQ